MRVLVVFGTRPEAIKLAPLIHRLRAAPDFTVRVCSTAQHREMTDQVVRFFELPVDYDLNIMRPRQSLFRLSARLLRAFETVLDAANPDLVIVQGDTTSALMAAMAGFYARRSIAHVEAGLRSHRKDAPFPEEINRRLISHLADYHFAPTPRAAANLAAEGIHERVWVVGNTVIDALFWALARVAQAPERWLRPALRNLDPTRRVVLVTAHRRENWGPRLRAICGAVRDLVAAFPDVQVAFPVHPNPRVRSVVEDVLGGLPRVHLLPPLTYPEFVWLMQQATLILTDSGGVQEEAPALGKPVLVLRDVTERPEGIEAGVAQLVGTRREGIVTAAAQLLRDPEAYRRMARATNPYGDGQTCAKIVRLLRAAGPATSGQRPPTQGNPTTGQG